MHVLVITHLVPSPDGSETVHERNILPKVGVKPETGRNGEVGYAEEDNAEDSHEEEKTEESKEAPTQVVDSLSQNQWPKRVQNDEEDDTERKGTVNLAHDLAAFV